MAKSHSQKKQQQAERETKREAQRKAAQKENTLKTMKRNIMISVLVLIVLAILITVFQSQAVSTEGLEELSLTAVAPTDTVKGNNSEIIIVEYSDFQCPACRSAEPMVAQLLEEYGDNITLIYRDFPLKQIHPKAMIAAQAAHAANAQGKYWEMHELLFTNQADWVNGNHMAIFSEYATQLELNVTQFEEDVQSDTTKAIVQHNYEHALSLGIQGTPTFYLNGKQVKITSGIEDFERRIDALLR